MTLASAARPFLFCFFRPVSTSMRFGWKAFSSFLFRVVMTIVSFLPVNFGLTLSTFLLAKPLYLKEFKPQRFPRSALSTGTPGEHLDFRMKELLFLTHSQISSDGTAMLTCATVIDHRISLDKVQLAKL